MSTFSLEELGIDNIDDLIEPEYLQKIRDTFAKSTGIEIILGRTEPGDYLVEAEPYHFCGQLRQKSAFVDKCNQGYMARLGDVMSTEGVFVCECHLGMLMFGAPLTVEGQVLGTLGGCMVSPESGLISRGRCEAICQQYGYDGDLDEMHRSLGEFPVYPPDKLASTLEIFKEMAIALSEVAKRQYQLKVAEAKKERLARYFSPSIFELIEGREELSYSGEASVLFSDIRNFTTRSERLTPAEVVEMLNEYFEEMVEAIFEHDGTLDKFIGDAVLAVFGAPVPSDQNARNAVLAAQQMLTKLSALNAKRKARGKQPIEIGIGIHTGKVMGGNIGSKKRMEYTVIGDTVNVASRLESLSKNYPESIIISDDTHKMVADLVEVAGAEEVQLKGKTAATRIHRVTGVKA
jgi:class 3 adenylate cyclase/ligand-binding sensor protein